jgi:hypothetical protein
MNPTHSIVILSLELPPRISLFDILTRRSDLLVETKCNYARIHRRPYMCLHDLQVFCVAQRKQYDNSCYYID